MELRSAKSLQTKTPTAANLLAIVAPTRLRCSQSAGFRGKISGKPQWRCRRVSWA